MKTDRIKVGDQFNNYKEICETLEEKYKTSNAKKAQLKMWENYFHFERKGNKYIIKEIYDKPLTNNMKESWKTFKHGMTGTKIHKVWTGIKSRCTYVGNPQYEDYGGRGIKMCEQWQDKENGFINFYSWAIEAGYKEEAGLSIDRIDVNGNYEPDNYRWVTQKVQTWNKRNTIYIKKPKSKIPEAQKAFMNKAELIKYLGYLENVVIELGEENKIIEYKNTLREKGLYTDDVEGVVFEGVFQKEEKTDEK